MRVGFIGVGNMGWPMAGRIRAAGHEVAVTDVDQARAVEFANAHGAASEPDPVSVARGREVVITMLPNSKVVEAVLDGPNGVLAGLSKGTILLEMSSGVPAHTRRLADRVAAAGGTLVDAPVSGGVSRAKTGELAVMVGGDPRAIALVDPVLKCMGTSILPTGGIGTAHAMKALNNLVSAGGFLIGVEALLIGKKFGLDPTTMVDVLNQSTGMNNSTQKKFKQFVLSRKFNSGFGLDLMVKDLTIALGIAEDTATDTPFAALCKKMWADALVADSSKGPDHTALAKYSERLAGAELD
jgi:3-hydroxyisobutyrate dehydrogenase